ncbi:hypothetical protein B0T14DRAFT_570570 [Immersiella caudata]|uniref:Uncharacterized protein n=1 Tax=Immersiella caudata TaxID=314043 RepID=A0AA39WFX1_9PEZI|nr:hypothetical protein B0T14DRAFT_570570 [Immersiella caudata]
MSSIFDPPGTNPPNPFSPVIEDYLSSSTASSSAQAASLAVEKVSSSSNPSNALYLFWDAFFNTVVIQASTSFDSHLTLLSSIRAHPPTAPTSLAPGSDIEKGLLTSGHLQLDRLFHWSKLPLFAAQWGDTHGILEAWRDWDGIRQPSGTSALSATPAEYFLRFVTFSAILLSQHTTWSKSVVHPINVFYAARNVLERQGIHAREDEPLHTTGGEHKLDAQQVWELDVRVTAIWLKWGGRALWEMDPVYLREHFARTLDWKADLWNQGKGLTRERWELWAARLRNLEGETEGETREVAREARVVVEGLLAGEEEGQK